MLNNYIQKIFDAAKRGDDREESYYSCLENLFYDYSNSINKKNIQVTTLPKKTEAGNPDFRIWDGKQNIVGYIEAKKPTEKNLDIIETSEQLKRYLKIFPNMILTNFFEFRLYRNGRQIDKVLIAQPSIIQKLKTVPPIQNEKEFFALLDKFFNFSLPKTYTAKSLAVELAKRTAFLKEIIFDELKEENGKGTISGFYEAFQKSLISTLNQDDFSDLFAQTITYGLFAARTRADNGFNRKLAYDYIPKTIGILREIFRFISLEELPKQMECSIDDISEVLAVADVKQILHKYFHEGKGKDPIVHFYETFLTEYDPKEREKRGVYYTPEPVVSYIVKSLHHILKKNFNRKDGFADGTVTVLDPAAGTLTFLAEASKLAVEEFVSKYGSGAKEKLIKEHILKNFYAFELMMAPYAIGHIKMSFLLEELGYKLKDDDRIKLYLTNTLDFEELQQSNLPGMSSLSEESHLAGEVKRKTPILAILGNPPYSGSSTNIGEWISKEIKEYYSVDGKPLGERNPKWLQDDYVKFIRFAQWKIDQAGEGVLGFITNHSYLDNPTFRGMRQSLMNSFNEIYLLDLHGNSLKKEKCPDGSKDENVFDIQQGVAVAIFVKKKNDAIKKIYHSEIYGLWEKKYEYLSKNDITKTKWTELKPHSDFYLFIPRDEKLLSKYEKYLKITDIFPVNGVGIVTARDKFVIDKDKNALLNRIRLFKNSKYADEELHTAFQINKKLGWDIRKAWNSLQDISDGELEKFIKPILYRPFDIQWIFYHDSIVWRTVKQIMQHMMNELIERPRREVMQHLVKENLSLLLTNRHSVGEYNDVFIGEQLIEGHVLSGALGISYVFPLYLYPEKEKKKKEKFNPKVMMLFEEKEKYQTKRPNINPEIFKKLEDTYKTKISSEDIFYYIYGLLYSNTYRKKYAEFLKIDFPRVPFTDDYKLFKTVGKLGKELANLHLLKSTDKSIAKFQGKSDDRVKKVIYADKKQLVYINDAQYFEGIPKEIWNYQIGGYQVLEKWLKDRKDKILSLEETKHYCQIATVLKNTIEIQKEIDKLYSEIEKRMI